MRWEEQPKRLVHSIASNYVRRATESAGLGCGSTHPYGRHRFHYDCTRTQEQGEIGREKLAKLA